MNEEVEILFVEDNSDDALLTIRALKKNNLTNTIIHLNNGEEALNFIFKGAEYNGNRFSALPKIILLDLKMPKVSGLEVLKEVKSNDKTKDIPVIVLTSSFEDPDIKKCYELGANSYVIKPVGFANFSEAISKIGLYWTAISK